MHHELSIVHRAKPQVFLEPCFPVWTTCLRSLAFTRCDAMGLEGTDQYFEREDAYRFLLEVICGLHSPILGETEVFGQFKNFAREWVKLDPSRMMVVQSLLSDAKFIRAKHLAHLGHQSYGSWVRKNLRAHEVHILGSGHMVSEILPYVQKAVAKSVLHVREKSRIEGFETHLMQAKAFGDGALLIAAPLSSQVITEWLNGKVPRQIFDLRDNSSQDPLAQADFKLADIFADLEATKSRLQPILGEVRQEIEQCSAKFFLKPLIRPQGWDDLCA